MFMSIVYFLFILDLCRIHFLSVQGLTAAGSTLPRKDASFSEIPIDANFKLEGKTIGERIKFGESLVEINNIVTQDECTWLVDACLRAAKDATKSISDQDKKPVGLVRIPTIAAAKRAAATQTLCGDPLPAEVDALLHTILKRTAEYIDEELPSIPSTLLFGTNNNDSLPSLADSFNDNRLRYSSREPAINVYTKGGEFLAHTDAQSLTILIPLSCPDRGDFSGGGTAFWSQDSRGHRVEDPSLIQRPCGGTAILFGGCVTHAGVSAEDGSRVVFVASLSPS